MKTKKVSSSKKIKKVKKASATAFFRNSPEIVEKQKALKELQNNKKNIENDLDKIVDIFNNNAITQRNAEMFIEKLSIDNLNDLSAIEKGNKNDLGLQVLNLRCKLRKDRNNKIEELISTNTKINTAHIDILLEKIKFTLEKSEEKK